MLQSPDIKRIAKLVKLIQDICWAPALNIGRESRCKFRPPLNMALLQLAIGPSHIVNMSENGSPLKERRLRKCWKGGRSIIGMVGDTFTRLQWATKDFHSFTLSWIAFSLSTIILKTMMIESLLISQRLETLSIVALDIQLIPYHHHNDHHNHHFVSSLRLKTFIVVLNIQPKNFTIIIILWFHFGLKHFLTGASIFRQGLSQESGNSSSPRWSLDPLAPPLTMAGILVIIITIIIINNVVIIKESIHCYRVLNIYMQELIEQEYHDVVVVVYIMYIMIMMTKRRMMMAMMLILAMKTCRVDPAWLRFPPWAAWGGDQPLTWLSYFVHKDDHGDDFDSKLAAHLP